MNRIKTMLALICAATVLHAQASLVILDKIVAVVDEDVVMLSELELRQNTIRAQLTAAGQQVPPDTMTIQPLQRGVRRTGRSGSQQNDRPVLG